MSGQRPKVLFVCGSVNQTRQMHKIAAELPELDAWFTPYIVDGFMLMCRELGLLEMTIAGRKLTQRCARYLCDHGLNLDIGGESFGHRYALAVLCTDQFYPRVLERQPVVLVQEGVLDPPNALLGLTKRFPRLVPRWAAGTAATGQSKRYAKFCVASEGYRDYFVSHGIPRDKIVVTGMPNFDQCSEYLKNDFPHRHYVLACTSDGRETGKLFDDRRAFIERVNEVAKGRQVIFKLHPNENLQRAKREIARWSPGALVFDDGVAEVMVANCDVLVCEYSSLAYVGLALGKEVHSYFDLGELRRLLPEQNRQAARNIAAVVRTTLVATKRDDWDTTSSNASAVKVSA